VVVLELEEHLELILDLLEAIANLEVLDEVLVLLRVRQTDGVFIIIISVMVVHLDPLLWNKNLGDCVWHHEDPEPEVWGPSEHVLHLKHLAIEVFDKARQW